MNNALILPHQSFLFLADYNGLIQTFTKPDLWEYKRAPPVRYSTPLTCQSHDFLKRHSGAGGTIMKLWEESAWALLRNGGRLRSGYTELSLFCGHASITRGVLSAFLTTFTFPVLPGCCVAAWIMKAGEERRTKGSPESCRYVSGH